MQDQSYSNSVVVPPTKFGMGSGIPDPSIFCFKKKHVCEFHSSNKSGLRNGREKCNFFLMKNATL